MPIPAITPYRFAQVFKAGGFTAALALGLVSAARSLRTIAEQFIQDMKDGKITEAAAEDHVAQELIIKRDIPITCKYISVLMNTPNAFGLGVACTVCHNSQDASKSNRGLDLSTGKGIIEGFAEKPKHTLFTPGTDPKRDRLIPAACATTAYGCPAHPTPLRPNRQPARPATRPTRNRPAFTS